jgi:uncharacterized protein YkwD
MLLFVLLVYFLPVLPATAQIQTPYPPITPSQIINAFNARRIEHGLAPLIVDPILMRTAQQTADYMALNHLGGHIGDVCGRVAAAGYGAGDIPWATENFMVGPLPLDQLMQSWSDDLHMIPVNNPNYKHIGAGVSDYDGTVYYVVHAAYTSNQTYKAVSIPLPGTPEAETPTADYMSQIIFPVRTVTPQADGRVFHTVKQGQTLWSIAIAYGTKILAIANANNLNPGNPSIYTGQKLLIPITVTPNTLTPTIENTPTETSTPAPTNTLAPAELTAAPTPTFTPQEQTLSDREKIKNALVTVVGIGAVLIALGFLFRNRG